MNYFPYRNNKYLSRIKLVYIMGKKGRPVKSKIRQNIIEILFHLKRGYGYEIYKSYVKVYPRVTLRSIYYHLKKGIDLGEFQINKIEKEKGNYSWGAEVEKIYYSLGENAKPIGDDRVRESISEVNQTE